MGLNRGCGFTFGYNAQAAVDAAVLRAFATILKSHGLSAVSRSPLLSAFTSTGNLSITGQLLQAKDVERCWSGTATAKVIMDTRVVVETFVATARMDRFSR